MKAEWSELFHIKTLDSKWTSFPKTAGIYIIRRKKAISRVGGSDPNGILYIGKSKNLGDRLWQFWAGNHTASGYLYSKPEVCTLIFGKRCKSYKEIELKLGELFFKFAAPIHSNKLESAETAVLYAYVKQFGEAPPLNLSLPNRWDNVPSAADLNWSKPGIE